MKPPQLEPLSAETERLLALERPLVREPDELRTRAMARARAAWRGMSAPPVGSVFRRRVGLLMAAALVMAFAAVSFAAWQRARSGTARPLGATSPALVGGLERPAEPALAQPSAVVDAPPSERTSVQEPVQVAEKSPVVAVPASTPAADGGALELALLERARSAVASGEFSTALGAIAEHQRRFPAGRLQEEREALRVKTLVALGRKDEARRVAERFRSRFPRSVLLPRIEAAIGPPP
jgi:hypothetical protein